jgi:hypothetical protein
LFGPIAYVGDENVFKTGAVVFEKIDSLCCACYRAFHYLLEDPAHAFLFRETMFTKYGNVIEIIVAVFRKLATLNSDMHLKRPSFRSQIIQIHRTPICD